MLLIRNRGFNRSYVHGGSGIFDSLRGNPVQNLINVKRKRKFFPTEQCKNYENWIRNKEVMTF